MPIIRKKLISSEVYPDTIRYNPTSGNVEVLLDGEWTPSPESDPRRQTTLPPRITSDSDCDAAQSVTDALKNQIDQTITAIDNGVTALQIAGLILGLFSFGVFAIFINIALAIADAMIGAGSTALTAALTNPVYEQLTCILFCNMDSEGRLTQAGLDTVMAEVSSEIGGLAATTINAMLALSGEGGINNLASLGTSTGDCSGCTDCGCIQGCTSDYFTYQWDDVAWIAHGAFSRYSAGTPVGSFDSFRLSAAQSTLDLGETHCIVDISITVNNGCPPGASADVELLIDDVPQFVVNPSNRAGCTPVSATWVFEDGIEGRYLAFRQVSDFCVGGYDNLLICAQIHRCIDV